MTDSSNNQDFNLPLNVLANEKIEKMVGGKFHKKVVYLKPSFSIKQLDCKQSYNHQPNISWLRSLFLTDLLNAEITAILLIGFSTQSTYAFHFYTKEYDLTRVEWVGMLDCIRRPFTNIQTVDVPFMEFSNLYTFLNKTIQTLDVEHVIGAVATNKGIYGSGIDGVQFSEIVYQYLKENE